MSRKNTDKNERAARRVAKLLRATPPEWIDLIDYVKFRTRCTTGMARKVLMSGALRVDSHPVGFKWVNDPMTGESVKVLDQYIDAKHRSHITVQWDEVEATR